MKDRNEIVDKQSEATVIATIIQNPRFVYHSEKFLKPAYFYDRFNGTLYWAVKKLVDMGIETVDANILSNIINKNPAAKAEVDGYDLKTLAEIVNASPIMAQDSIDGYQLFAKQVTALSYKRDLYDKLIVLTNDCFNGKISVMDLNKKVDLVKTELSQKYIIGSDVVTMGTKLDDIWEDVVSNRNPDGTVGIPSIIPLLNEFLGGYRRNSLTLFSAAPKTGKSTLLMDEALSQLKSGLAVVYFDSEMSDQEFLIRSLASLTGIPSRNIETGRYTEEEAKRLQEEMDWLKDNTTKLYHQYMPVPNMDEVYETTKMLCEMKQCDVCIYDYIKNDAPTASENYNVLGNMTNFLKNTIGGGLNLPVLGAVQSKRNSTEVGDSWKIVRYASAIISFQEKTAEEIRNEGNDVAHNGSHRLFVQFNRNGMHHLDGDNGISLCFKGATSQIWQAPNQPKTQAPFDEDEY